MDKIKEIINKLLGKGKDSKPSDSSGFTLVELLIVIAVIGILAAALLLAIDPIDKIRAGNDTKVINDVRQIYDGASRVYAQTGEFPVDLDDIVAKGELNRVPAAPGDYDIYVMHVNPTGDGIVVYGEVKSKSNRVKGAGVDTADAYFVAASDGACYHNAEPADETFECATEGYSEIN